MHSSDYSRTLSPVLYIDSSPLCVYVWLTKAQLSSCLWPSNTLFLIFSLFQFSPQEPIDMKPAYFPILFRMDMSAKNDLFHSIAIMSLSDSFLAFLKSLFSSGLIPTTLYLKKKDKFLIIMVIMTNHRLWISLKISDNNGTLISRLLCKFSQISDPGRSALKMGRGRRRCSLICTASDCLTAEQWGIITHWGVAGDSIRQPLLCWQLTGGSGTAIAVCVCVCAHYGNRSGGASLYVACCWSPSKVLC